MSELLFTGVTGSSVSGNLSLAPHDKHEDILVLNILDEDDLAVSLGTFYFSVGELVSIDADHRVVFADPWMGTFLPRLAGGYGLSDQLWLYTQLRRLDADQRSVIERMLKVGRVDGCCLAKSAIDGATDQEMDRALRLMDMAAGMGVLLDRRSFRALSAAIAETGLSVSTPARAEHEETARRVLNLRTPVSGTGSTVVPAPHHQRRKFSRGFSRLAHRLALR